MATTFKIIVRKVLIDGLLHVCVRVMYNHMVYYIKTDKLVREAGLPTISSSRILGLKCFSCFCCSYRCIDVIL